MEYKDESFKTREFLKIYTYYFIIGIASLIVLIIGPFIGSDLGAGFKLPHTVPAWIVWVTIKVIAAGLNVLIFHSFMQQAKVNVRDNSHYKEAKEILGRTKRKNYIPRSPEKWTAKQYGTKGTTIFIFTALGTVALTQAILTFDYVSLITYLITVVMGVIFGILQMKNAEIFWTEEFYAYALMVKEDMEMAKKERAEQEHDTVDDNSRDTVLESVHYNGDISLNCESMVLDRLLSGDSFLVRPIDASSTYTDSSGTIPESSMGKENKDTTFMEVNNVNNRRKTI